MSRKQAVALMFLVPLVLVGAVGCGEQSYTGGFGTFVVTSVAPVPLPARGGVPLTITGGDFTQAIGVSAEITWIATAGTPFGGGTKSQETVTGTVTSATTIESVTPSVVVCGTADVTATIRVTLAAGVTAESTAATATFVAPTITNIDNDAAPGTTFEACNPTPFTVTGTGFGPVGGTAMVRFTSTSAAPAATPFGGGATIEVPGTIVSATTITGVSPEATLFPTLVGGAGVCMSLSADADVDVTLPGGSCTPAPFSSATFAGPALTSVAVAGFTAPDVPSTVLLGNASAETFTLTGMRFGPAGSTAMVTFEDLAAGAPFDGGVNAVAVVGLVVDSTTITGTLPTITATRLTANLTVRVRVVCANGSGAFCNDAANFVAPPTITAVTTTRAPFNQAAPATPLASTWLAGIATDTTITGTGFHAMVADLWYDSALGPATPIGAGLLGPIPGPTAALPMATLRTVTAPTTINGGSPTDATLTQDTPVTVRVVNPDGQFHALGGLTFATTGVLANVNAGPLAGNNAEMQLSVNPTDPLNACIIAHDLRTINGQFSNQIYHAYTRDGGATWVQFPIGPDTTAAADGIGGAAQRAFRFDPMGAFDAYGNYFAVYLLDDNVAVPGPSRFCVLQRSSDGGATFDFTGTLSFPPSPGLDRETIAIGPNVGIGAGGQALYCALVDGMTGEILTSKTTIADGPGPGGTVTIIGGSGTPSGPPPPGRFFAHGTPSVGPAGESYVSYTEGEAGGVFPLPPFADTLIFMDQDLFGSGVYQPFDVLVATTLNAPFRLVDGSFTPMPSRGKSVIPMHQVIPVGPNAGRVVIAWSDMNPMGPTGLDTTVVTQVSDDQNLTWSTPRPVHGLHPGFQFHPWMGVDPVRGDLYLGYYDNRNAVAPNPGDVQWLVTASEDGVTWSASFLVSQGASRAGPYIAPGNTRNDMLEYNGIGVVNGLVYTCWADNGNFTGDNPDGAFDPAGFDVLMSLLMLDPDDN